MVYINENSTNVTLPRVSKTILSKIRFINQITKQSFEMLAADNSGGSIYNIDITPVIDQFENGQYDYILLTDNNSVITSGIIQYKEFKPNTVEYTVNNGFIQYNP